MARGALFRINGRPTGAIVLAQNRETLQRLGHDQKGWVFPNALAVDAPAAQTGVERSGVVFIGRLIPWKGVRLAIRAFARLESDAGNLRIFGDGPDRRNVEAEINRLGLTDRVSLEGVVPRMELLGELASAGALIHTAFREEAGWGVAEALTYKTPVVCLDHGGPRVLAEFWPDSPISLVAIEGPEDLEARMAEELVRHLGSTVGSVDEPASPRRSFREVLLESYEAAARTSY